MASQRTEVTEITTGLAMLGFPSLERALEVRPRSVLNVEPSHYDRLDETYAGSAFDREFDVAWRNGLAFARSQEGLRGRPPQILEWKGQHRPPGYDQLPADLRVDHVYLISCKYGSNILTNSSPANLFNRLLGDRHEAAADWFNEVAPDAYQAFYAECRRYLDDRGLPDQVDQLSQADRHQLKRLPRRLPGELQAAYLHMADEVAAASATRWLSHMTTTARREQMLWRLLRLQSAPYFVLGESVGHGAIGYRVATPWDFRNRYRFKTIEAWRDTTRRQPVVQWCAVVTDHESAEEITVAGHVEVRWSHGRFAQVPEAKVYLDTPHHGVPGYVPLTQTVPPDARLGLAFEHG